MSTSFPPPAAVPQVQHPASYEAGLAELGFLRRQVELLHSSLDRQDRELIRQDGLIERLTQENASLRAAVSSVSSSSSASVAPGALAASQLDRRLTTKRSSSSQLFLGLPSSDQTSSRASTAKALPDPYAATRRSDAVLGLLPRNSTSVSYDTGRSTTGIDATLQKASCFDLC